MHGILCNAHANCCNAIARFAVGPQEGTWSSLSSSSSSSFSLSTSSLPYAPGHPLTTGRQGGPLQVHHRDPIPMTSQELKHLPTDDGPTETTSTRKV